LNRSGWRARKRWDDSSGSVPHSRRRGPRSRSRRRRSRASTGSWCRSASRTRTSASPLRRRRPRTSSCSVRQRRRVGPSRWRRSRLKVSLFPFSFRSWIRSFGVRSQLHLSLFVASRPADHPGACDHPGRDVADGIQLLSTGVGRVAGRRP
jgi:hypothetical protein